MEEDFTVLFHETMDDPVDITKLGDSSSIGLRIHITMPQETKEIPLDLQSELRILDLAGFTAPIRSLKDDEPSPASPISPTSVDVFVDFSDDTKPLDMQEIVPIIVEDEEFNTPHSNRFAPRTAVDETRSFDEPDSLLVYQ